MAAERDDGDSRTEQPTPRRLQRAREEGAVPRVHGMAAAAVLITAAAALAAGGAHFANRLALTLRLGLLADPGDMQDPQRLLIAAGRVIGPSLGVLISFLALLAAAGAAAEILVGGWIFSFQPLVPDPARLDPAAGMRRLFSRTALIETLKAWIKFLVIGAIAAFLVWDGAGSYLQLAVATWPQALYAAALLWLHLFAILAVALFGLAALEAPYQFWAYRARFKMTRQELKDELRELDVSPQTKRRIRALRQRLARMRMTMRRRSPSARAKCGRRVLSPKGPASSPCGFASSPASTRFQRSRLRHWRGQSAAGSSSATKSRSAFIRRSPRCSPMSTACALRARPASRRRSGRRTAGSIRRRNSPSDALAERRRSGRAEGMPGRRIVFAAVGPVRAVRFAAAQLVDRLHHMAPHGGADRSILPIVSGKLQKRPGIRGESCADRGFPFDPVGKRELALRDGGNPLGAAGEQGLALLHQQRAQLGEQRIKRVGCTRHDMLRGPKT